MLFYERRVTVLELPMFYDEAEEWSRALLLYDAALKELNTKLEIWNNEFKLAHQYNPIEHITSRIKSPQSIAKKMRRYNEELTTKKIMERLNDVAGIRIICSFTSDIYRIADLLASQKDVRVLRIKDYIKEPKDNGYTSYHMIASIPIALSSEVIETKVEIQIRTIAMDFWASLEHKIYYKFEGNAPAHIQRELKECADIVGFLDQKMLSINEEIKRFGTMTYESYETEEDDSDTIDVLATIHEIVDSSEHVSAKEVIKKEAPRQEVNDKIPFPENAFVFGKRKAKK